MLCRIVIIFNWDKIKIWMTAEMRREIARMEGKPQGVDREKYFGVIERKQNFSVAAARPINYNI